MAALLLRRADTELHVHRGLYCSRCSSPKFTAPPTPPPKPIDDNQVGFYDLLKIEDKGGLFGLVFAMTGLEICCTTLIQFSLISAIFQ